ncbi:MAG: ribonuclease D [Brevefilum sp.]
MSNSLKNIELVWVDQPQQLHQAAQELAEADILAVDTESNSLYAYQEQVCLIQFSTRDKDYLVDALVLPDLSPLAEIFISDRILKVFHAAEYDLICLFRDYGFRFNYLFDTMIAARILGYQKIGLGSLLEKYFRVQMNKKYQRANWGKRPLKADMLEYARLDSRYLISLQDELRAELIAADRWELALEDFRRLTQGVEDTTESSEEDFWKIHGARDLSPEKAAVLKSLYQYRESVAKGQNRPPFKVISHQALIEMAEVCPKQYTDLLNLSALHKNQATRYGRGLLEAIRAGKQAPPACPPNHTRPHNSVLHRIDALQDWRKHTGRSLGVPSDVVLPRDVLNRIAWANPRDKAALEVEMHDVPYRFDRFGDQILAIIS